MLFPLLTRLILVCILISIRFDGEDEINKYELENNQQVVISNNAAVSYCKPQ